MQNRTKNILVYVTLIVVTSYFLFLGLSMAQSFLAPLVIAVLLAMIVLPVAKWMERKGVSRGWSSLFSTFIILLFFIILTGVLTAQVKSLVEQWPQVKEQVVPKIEKFQQYVANKTGLSVDEQNKKIEEILPGNGSGESSGENSEKGNSQKPGEEGSRAESGGGSEDSGGGGAMSSAGSFLVGFAGFMGNFLLTFVYIFFLLLYRGKFKRSIVSIAPEEHQQRTEDVINKSAQLSQDYLSGRLLLIIILAIVYSIGLFISGVNNAILISILAAVLTLIPYIGNIIGYILAVGMAFFSGSGLTGAIGVTITFSVAQFVESYILEPYVVGDKVNLNPLIVIIVVVLGGAVWGVAGMLIAIPVLGILKVVFDHVSVLKPLSNLLGDNSNDGSSGPGFLEKTKRWAKEKFGS